jgi:hypothetical protein
LPGIASSRLYSIYEGTGGTGIFKSYVVATSSLGDGRMRVRERTVVSGKPTFKITDVDCHRPKVGGRAITITDNESYRPPLSDWSETNLWWAACRGEYRRYGGRLKGAIPDE